MSNKLTHFDADGRARMVDVGGKQASDRTARAQGFVALAKETLAAITANQAAKGDVLAVAELAGIMAAKKTADLIPLCHPLSLSRVKLVLTQQQDGILVVADVACSGQTGVEMEALTAVSVACLTVYDMIKAIDKAARIGPIELIEKTGGKSGSFRHGPK